MIYGYIRVSTNKQTVLNQRFEISKYCSANNLAIDGWIEETISGTKNYDKRKLGHLLKRIHSGDLIICAELSRLGRSLFMIMEVLNICMTKQCRVWTVKEGYKLGEDIQSKVLAFAFGLSAEIERKLISQRTKEALDRKRAEGHQLGRPKGSKNKHYRLETKDRLIQRLAQQGVKMQEIASRCRVSYKTLYNHLHRQTPIKKSDNRSN